MKKIDIIILSNTANEHFHNLLSITVNSIKAQTDVESNIILVETNKEYKTKEQYNLPIDILVVPDELFHFNKFLNYGLKYSTADFICFSNNDVKYHAHSLYHLVEAMQSYDSVSPHGLGYGPHLNTDSVIDHCQLNASFLGWCFCFTRKTLNECFGGNFDERFAFYRQDDDIVRTLAFRKLRHALVGPAKVEHLNLMGYAGRGANSYGLFGTEEQTYHYTESPEQMHILNDKWNKIYKGQS
jgi:glycosyltransferase involved in cell wall biosynthesis